MDTLTLGMVNKRCKVPLNESEMAEVRRRLHYEPSTGLFTRKFSERGAPVGTNAGCVHRQTGYVVISFMNKKMKAHRLAWAFMYGEWPPQFLDHINGDRTDNRISNLRLADDYVNAQNQRVAQRSNKSTGLLGASFHKHTGRYVAVIRIGGKSKHLGLFDTAQAAHEAYIAAKRVHHIGGVL